MTLEGSALRVGIVGCGYATTDRHLPALRRIGEAEVVAVADTDASATGRVAAQWGIPRSYGTVEELVADESVDVVAVCTPPAHHAEAAVAALEAGKHVLVEKPLAASLDDADELLRRAASTDQVATIGFNLRWHAQVRRARELVRSGRIGGVHYVHTAFTDPILQRQRMSEWRRRRSSGGGALLDKATHHFDLWRFLLGDEVESVHAFVRGDDETVVVSGRMRGGALTTTVASDLVRVRHDVTILGDAGEIGISVYRFDGLDLASVEEIDGSPRSRVRRARSSFSQLPSGLRSMRLGGDFALSYDEQWRAFAHAVRHGRAPETTLEDGRRALEIAFAAAASADAGDPVALESFAPTTDRGVN